MAITHKRQDDLETMFANFAKVPGISTDPEETQEDSTEKASKEKD